VKPLRFVVGLTGGIGTGKSAALAEFRRCGAETFSADDVARAQAEPGREGYRAIVRTFGHGVLSADGRLDRRALGAKVFRDVSARRRLEKATHPFILRELKRRAARAKGVVVVDVPLLFEAKLEERFDAVIVVSCSPAAQARRVARRDGLSGAEIRRRVRAQMPLTRKISRADLTIENDGSRADLRRTVRAAHKGLALLYGGTPNGNAD
jgi:dephospho-CoA kinase